ncbi:MAG: glutaminase A [Chitinophagaceae bacterium]
MKKQISKSHLVSVVEESYQKIKSIKGGKNADYIPYLANVDSTQFAVSVALPDGSIIQQGNTDFMFGIESISKVLNAILVLKQSGSEALLNKIGANATGMPFNSIMAILLENNQPDTPLVNSGAIAAVSMIEPIGNEDDKWKAMLDNIEALCGSSVMLIEELYMSESKTNFNNRSIAWLLKNYDKIYDHPDLSLDLYTRGCSLGVTSKQLSIAAATIANKGKNPITGDQVFDQSCTSKIIALMATVGFYENTGNWMYTSGIPAKTGVGGGVMGILPGLFGIAAFSPQLDASGNSVKAQAVIQYIVNALNINVYNGDYIEVI